MDWPEAEARVRSLFPIEEERAAVIGQLAKQADTSRFFTDSDPVTKTRLQQLVPAPGMHSSQEDSPLYARPPVLEARSSSFELHICKVLAYRPYTTDEAIQASHKSAGAGACARAGLRLVYLQLALGFAFALL